MIKKFKKEATVKGLAGYRLKNNYSSIPVAAVCDEESQMSIF